MTEKVTIFPPRCLLPFTLMSSGTTTLGAVVSRTVTLNDAPLVFPSTSVAVQVTVVTPSGNVEPEAGTQVTVRLLPF